MIDALPVDQEKGPVWVGQKWTLLIPLVSIVVWVFGVKEVAKHCVGLTGWVQLIEQRAMHKCFS